MPIEIFTNSTYVPPPVFLVTCSPSRSCDPHRHRRHLIELQPTSDHCLLSRALSLRVGLIGLRANSETQSASLSDMVRLFFFPSSVRGNNNGSSVGRAASKVTLKAERRCCWGCYLASRRRGTSGAALSAGRGHVRYRLRSCTWSHCLESGSAAPLCPPDKPVSNVSCLPNGERPESSE